MAKSKQKPAKSAGKGKQPAPQTLKQRSELVEDARRECRALLKDITARRLDQPEGTVDATLTGSVNSLSKSIAILSAEGRQLDKHQETAVIDLDHDREDELVRSFLTSISPQRRRAFREFLQEQDEVVTMLGH